jgi:hypothetical protein
MSFVDSLYVPSLGDPVQVMSVGAVYMTARRSLNQRNTRGHRPRLQQMRHYLDRLPRGGQTFALPGPRRL